jgi:hypothetical protein
MFRIEAKAVSWLRRENCTRDIKIDAKECPGPCPCTCPRPTSIYTGGVSSLSGALMTYVKDNTHCHPWIQPVRNQSTSNCVDNLAPPTSRAETGKHYQRSHLILQPKCEGRDKKKFACQIDRGSSIGPGKKMPMGFLNCATFYEMKCMDDS